jgi:hypothetical protein
MKFVSVLVFIVLAVLLVGSLSYIGVGIYKSDKQSAELEIFQQGAQYGYEQAVIQAVELAVTCEEVPFRIENQTIGMIATECLQR